MNIKKTAYYDSVKELEEKGYITLMRGNRYLFHTTPFRKNGKILSADSENPEIEMIDFSGKTETFSGKTETHSGKTETGVRKNGREIAGVLEPVITKVKSFAADGLERIANIVVEHQDSIDKFVDAIASFGNFILDNSELIISGLVGIGTGLAVFNVASII